MKRWSNFTQALSIGAVLVALSAVGAYAQTAPGQKTRSQMYDTKTETTITGIVQEVKEVSGRGRSTGTHLLVKAGDEIYDVHVGPTWYLKQQKYVFAKEDQVEVTGSKVKYQGADAILARQIKKGGNTWTLRDPQGIPNWSRSRSR